MLTLLKLYDYLIEKMKDQYEDFIHITEKVFRKTIMTNDELYIQHDRSGLDYIEPFTFADFKRLVCLDLFMNNLKLIETETFKGIFTIYFSFKVKSLQV